MPIANGRRTYIIHYWKIKWRDGMAEEMQDWRETPQIVRTLHKEMFYFLQIGILQKRALCLSIGGCGCGSLSLSRGFWEILFLMGDVVDAEKKWCGRAKGNWVDANLEVNACRKGFFIPSLPSYSRWHDGTMAHLQSAKGAHRQLAAQSRTHLLAAIQLHLA